MLHGIRALALSTLAVLVLAAAPARAQMGGVIKFYVGAAPGGPVETYARILADHMSRTLGASIVIEVRPGANGVVAANVVQDAPADGRSVWIATQSMIEINPLVYSDLRWKIDDFMPVIKGVEAPIALVTNPEVPAKTLPELIDWIKKNPGKLSLSSYSPGTPGHFIGVQMNERFGLDLAQVPYKGSAPQITDTLGGYSKLGFFQTAPVIPHLQAGALRAIAVTSARRFSPMPDTPTFTELGYPDFLATVWYGLLVKKGTPADIVAKIAEAAKAAHADNQVQVAFKALGVDVVAVTEPEFGASIRAGAEHWGRRVKATGFKATE